MVLGEAPTHRLARQVLMLSEVEPDLTAARALRDEARERLTAAIDAVVILRRADADAQAAFTAARDRAVWCAGEIFAAEANARAERVAEMKRATWRDEDALAALVELRPGGALLRCSPAVGTALGLNRERYDADRRPGMPFGKEHHLALWQEYLARLLNDAAAVWQWRPPRPEDRKTVNLFARPGAVPSFKPRSAEAAEHLAAEAAEAAAQAEARGPAPFSHEPTVAEAFRRQRARLEAEQEAAAEMAARQRAAAGSP
jgi:hypothetical protein